jgi:hypothetical protein
VPAKTNRQRPDWKDFVINEVGGRTRASESPFNKIRQQFIYGCVSDPGDDKQAFVMSARTGRMIGIEEQRKHALGPPWNIRQMGDGPDRNSLLLRHAFPVE